MSRWLLNIEKEGVPTISLSDLCQGLVNLTAKKVLSGILKGPSIYRIVPIISGPVSGHHLKAPSLHPHFIYLWTLMRTP